MSAQITALSRQVREAVADIHECKKMLAQIRNQSDPAVKDFRSSLPRLRRKVMRQLEKLQIVLGRSDGQLRIELTEQIRLLAWLKQELSSTQMDLRS